MSGASPQRIVELWPALTERQREALVGLAEDAATPLGGLELTGEETAALARSKDDFAAGRTLSFAEAEAATDEFLRSLRAKP